MAEASCAVGVSEPVLEVDRARAFERFTQHRLDRAYRLAGLVLRDPVGAEDAVQEAVILAWQRWPALRDPTRLDAWFDRILVNECRARLRRRRVREVRMSGVAPVAAAPADDVGAFHARETVRDALWALDADHRIVVVLRYGMDLSPAEIATRTGAREGTVKSRLHYALRAMRAAIEAGDRPGRDR